MSTQEFSSPRSSTAEVETAPFPQQTGYLCLHWETPRMVWTLVAAYSNSMASMDHNVVFEGGLHQLVQELN
ncbi:MAG: hypothetical protein ABW092_11365 [Candidatus Thiodiazotropha sp.]